MSKIIIGIHGLGNKPDEVLLESWWRSSIREGLEGKGRFHFLKFGLVYWASILYRKPFDFYNRDKKHPLFLNEPYLWGSLSFYKEEQKGIILRLRNQLLNQFDKIILEKDGSLNFESLTDFIMKHFFKDLSIYYQNIDGLDDDEQPHEKICMALAQKLIRNRRKKILLIAHSMGSIIAWDVLTKYVPHINVDTFVTIGSPLGIPIIRSKILSQSQIESNQLKTPNNIQRAWFNLSDINDKITINYNLNENILKNTNDVGPIDKLVWNNYECKGERNPHKSYGYLRCNEMGEIVSHFLKGKIWKDQS